MNNIFFIKILILSLLLLFSAKASLSNIESCSLALVVSSQESNNVDNLFYKNTSKINSSFGTAFFYYDDIKKHYYILTNLHVVEKALKKNNIIYGCNNEMNCKKFQLLAIDKKFDLAFLSPIDLIEFPKNCNFQISNDFENTDPVLIYGNKFGMGLSFAKGIVAAKNIKIEKDGDENEVHFFDINAGYGNSGGAVFLEKSNQIISIVNSIYSAGNTNGITFGITGINIKTSIERMNEMLDTQNILEFTILEKENNIFIQVNSENIFFEKINLRNTDQIQTLGKKQINNKVEFLYEIYNFLNSDIEDLPITAITADKKLKSLRLKKYRSNADFGV